MNPELHATEHEDPDARLLAHAVRLTFAPKLDIVHGAGAHFRFAEVLSVPMEHDSVLLVAVLVAT